MICEWFTYLRIVFLLAGFVAGVGNLPEKQVENQIEKFFFRIRQIGKNNNICCCTCDCELPEVANPGADKAIVSKVPVRKGAFQQQNPKNIWFRN